MRHTTALFTLALLHSIAGTSPISFAATPGAVQGTVPDFSIPGANGETISLSNNGAEITVLCFLGVECPLARVYGPRLDSLAEKFADQGVRFIGINSNIQDSMDDLKGYVGDHKLKFPCGKDYDRNVALSAKATRTPEVVVVDRNGNIRYRGRIDDQYQPGIARNEATRHDLRRALEQLVAGQDVSTPRTEAVGCLIALPRKSSESTPSNVTYCNQVARVLQKHCVECHREGEIGPFVLDDFDEVVGWADMMVEVIDEKRMPPWHASPNHGSFANARHMPESDKELIRKWVASGTPFGDADELPKKPEYLSGWRLPREPDEEYDIHRDGFAVPADGIVEYQYFVVDPKFTEDKWIRAAQVIPGNPSVVHHCIVFVRPPDGSGFDDFGLVSAYVPGQTSTTLPEGYARKIPAGSRFVFQMHYTPTGTPQLDKTKLGLVFAKPESVTHEVVALVGIQQQFEIPPNTAEHTVFGKVRRFPKHGKLLAIAPHMHLRGRSFRLHAITSQQTKTLLDVPHYDFNWQHSYELSEELPLDQIQELHFEATFDNSADNPTNPEPNEYVYWGDQTWQEMAVLFLTVATPIAKPDSQGQPEPARPDPRARFTDAEIKKASRLTKEYFDRFDKNGDGTLSFRELPTSVRMFTNYDDDRDGVISWEEIQSQSLSRVWRAR